MYLPKKFNFESPAAYIKLAISHCNTVSCHLTCVVDVSSNAYKNLLLKSARLLDSIYNGRVSRKQLFALYYHHNETEQPPHQ
jgi:hypothetical protein